MNKVIEIKKLLKKRKLFLANWGCADPDTFQCRDWIPYLNKTFGKLIVFSLRNYYYKFGRKALNEKFLEILKNEKPDYLLFGHRYDEISIETIRKIKEISPTTKTIIEFGDDDFRFDDWGRYYSLFFDYIFTPKKELEIYSKDKIKGALFFISINPGFYKPMKLNKIYDVTFIGRPVADRYEYIKFLKERGVNIRLFGVGWGAYPDLKEIYGGVLYNNDFVKVMNQSKINLNLSKTLYKKGEAGQFKGRVLEVGACNSFLLTEYTSMNPEFLNKQDEMNFKTKEELLTKIDYYLKNEKEREELTKKFYDYVIKNYSLDSVFTKKFYEIERKSINKKFPPLEFKIANFSKSDFALSSEELSQKFMDVDYITFCEGNIIESTNKKYFHPYSLFISNKKISCCDYNVASKSLGDYLTFNTKKTFNTAPLEEFCKLINLNQIMVTRDFFLENFLEFKKFYETGFSKIFSEKNIVFISIPLFSTNYLPKINYNQFTNFFYPLFFDELVSKIWQKKILHPYLFNFFFYFLQNPFIRKYILQRLFDQSNLNAIKTFKK